MATIPRAPTFSPKPVPPSAPWIVPSANFKLLNSIKPVGVQNFSATQVPIVDPWKVPPNLVATTLFSLFTYPLAERGVWRWPPTYQVTVDPWKAPSANFKLLNSVKPVGRQQAYGPTAILPNVPWTVPVNIVISTPAGLPPGVQIFSATQQIATQPWPVPGNILASTLISTFPVGEQNFSTTQQVSVQPWSVPGNSLISTLISTFPVGQQVWSQTAQVSVVPWMPPLNNSLIIDLTVFPVGEQVFSQTQVQTVQPWIAPPNTLQTTLSLILIPSSPLWLSDEYVPQGPPPGWVQSSPTTLLSVLMPVGKQSIWLPTQLPPPLPSLSWTQSSNIALQTATIAFPAGKQTPWLPTQQPILLNQSWLQPSDFALFNAAITFPPGKQAPWLPTQLPPPSAQLQTVSPTNPNLFPPGPPATPSDRFNLYFFADVGRMMNP